MHLAISRTKIMKISFRRLLIIVLVFTVLIPLSACKTDMSGQSQQTKAQEKTVNRPNIVLILAEDLSPRIGAYGDKVATTPVLDALAEESVVYNYAFTAAGVCAPSRSALITGMHQQSIGTMHMRTSYKGKVPGFQYEAVIPPRVKAFPELMRRAGYYVTNNSKTDYQFGNPFTVWDESSSKASWRNRPKGKPFFAMITIVETHESYIWDPDMDDDDPTAVRVTTRNKNFYKKRPAITDPKDVIVPPYYPDTPVVRAALARHYDNIHYMDGRVGEILARIKEDGLDKNTIVIWSTDHGDGLPRAKRSVYEGGLRVPFMIRFPDGKEAGVRKDELISFVDLAPTILTLAHADRPDYLQGINFLGGDRDLPNKYIYGAVDRLDGTYERSRAVRSARFKYIRNFITDKPLFHPLHFRDRGMIMKELNRLHKEDKLNAIQELAYQVPRPDEELYDLKTDPWEVHNLAKDTEYSDTLARMRQALAEHTEKVGDMGTISEREMYLKMWPGGVQPMTKMPDAEIDMLADGGKKITLDDKTEGASIGYRLLEDGHPGPWLLYVKPVNIGGGEGLEAKAVRYGYGESKILNIKP